MTSQPGNCRVRRPESVYPIAPIKTVPGQKKIAGPDLFTTAAAEHEGVRKNQDCSGSARDPKARLATLVSARTAPAAAAVASGRIPIRRRHVRQVPSSWQARRARGKQAPCRRPPRSISAHSQRGGKVRCVSRRTNTSRASAIVPRATVRKSGSKPVSARRVAGKVENRRIPKKPSAKPSFSR